MWILPKQLEKLHTLVSVLDTKESEKDLEEFCQMSEKSLLWRSKPSLLRTWLRRWKRNSWIQHLSIRTLRPSHTESFVDKWTSLSGGFPCQPFSQAGARKATEDPRHLFPYIAEGIRECQPRIVFLENVEGIISAKTTDGESVLRYVLRTLEGLGYRATAGIFSASEVGFPHQRKRVFILGNSKGTRQSSSDDRSGQAQLGGTSSRNAQSELSDTDIERLEGSVFKGKPREQTEESSSGCSWGKYPARPNEEQYEWEAPRVVEAKPRLGGATNGSSNRVDRLRLLGNGVVPQTAAKAFETLIKRVL
jgi:DNA (cytosine-5)-methyltransferase 1